MIKYNGYYGTTTPDIDGGLLCQIYADECLDNEIDWFVYHGENIDDAELAIKKQIDQEQNNYMRSTK